MSTLTSPNFDRIIIFDACRFSSNEGEVRILNEEEISTFATSTHTSSIELIISYIRKFSKAEVFVIGISITRSVLFSKISEKVKKSADDLIGLINNAIC